MSCTHDQRNTSRRPAAFSRRSTARWRAHEGICAALLRSITILVPFPLFGSPGCQKSLLERADGVDQISHVLRLEPEEWRAMCYRHVKGRNRFNQRLFYGERISADDLNYGSPTPMPRLPSRAPDLVGCVGSRPRYSMPHPPMSSIQPVPCLQEEVGLAAASCAPVSLRARLSRSRCGARR